MIVIPHRFSPERHPKMSDVRLSIDGINRIVVVVVAGVPYFYMNGQKMFSGAQDEATIVRMFEIVTEKFPLEPPTQSAM